MLLNLPNRFQKICVVASVALGSLVFHAPRCEAAVTLEIDNVTFTPGQTSEFNVYAAPTTAGDSFLITGIEFVLTLGQVTGNPSIQFTNALADDDLTGNLDYVFSEIDPFDILTSRIGDTNSDSLRIGRSDNLDIDLFEFDGRFLIGQFQLAARPMVPPDAGDQFQISVDEFRSFFIDDFFDPLTIDGFTGGLVTVSAVPEPTSFLAMGLGVGVIGFRRRRKSSKIGPC